MSAGDAMQDYLAEAYRLAYYQESDPYIKTSDLAAVKGVSAPAVTRMVQRLRDAGYLEHEPYRGVRLTPAGEREALYSIRKHRLVERFLVDVMRFGWHEVHDAADELGAVVSDAVVARMSEMSGHPRRCPHGEPIPTAEGHMPRVVDYPLQDVAVDADYIISRVNSHDEEILRYLDSLGVRPGAKMRFLSRAPFNGPLQIEIKGQQHHIGYELSQVMRVSSEDDFNAV